MTLILNFIFYKCIYLFLFYFWLHWVFVAARRLSLVAVSGGYSVLWCTGFSLLWLLLLWSMGSRCAGFSSCGTWAQQLWLTGSRGQALQLWRMGLVAPRHMGSSRTRARTCVPCIGRQILNHCATREVPLILNFKMKIVIIIQFHSLHQTFSNHFKYLSESHQKHPPCSSFSSKTPTFPEVWPLILIFLNLFFSFYFSLRIFQKRTQCSLIHFPN